nr:hypothetical protein [Pseudomonas aeruginosa]
MESPNSLDGAEAWSWRSVASGNTQLAAGAGVSPWWGDSSGTTQLAVGAEVSSWWSGSSGTTQPPPAPKSVPGGVVPVEPPTATGAEVGSW